MPRASYEQITSSPSEEHRPEGIRLSEADYERLSNLFHDLGTHPDNRAQELARDRLPREGSKAVQYVFETYVADAQTQGDAVELYDGLRWLEYCWHGHDASPEDMERIGELLTDDLICYSSDSSCRTMLTWRIENYGTPANAGHLVAFAEKIKATQPEMDFPYFEVSRNEDALPYQQLADLRSAEYALNELIDRILSNSQRQQRDEEEYIKLQEASQHVENMMNELREELPHSESMTHQPSDWEQFASFRPAWEEERPEYDPASDDAIDERIEEEYDRHQFSRLESRIETVRRLRHEAQKEQEIKEEPEDDEAKFLRRHWLEYRENNPSPYTPTLGIEVEIREHTVLSPEENKELKTLEEVNFSEYHKRIEKKRVPYRKTEALGVPRGDDKFYEFAHRPVRYYPTLSREVQALIEAGLINKDYPRHPLHLTIGDISLGMSAADMYTYASGELNEEMPDHGKEVFVLARVLEATSWSTTGGRLTRPYLTKGPTYGWAIKGVGGVKERERSEIALDTKTAVELRTFQLQSIVGLDRLLRSSFLLGTALKAYQRIAQEKAPGEQDAVEIDLARIWDHFSFDCRELFQRYDLPDPHDVWRAPQWEDSPSERKKNFFARLGNLIDEAQKSPDSHGADFVSQIRKTIIAARRDIAAIIYAKKTQPEKKDKRET